MALYMHLQGFVAILSDRKGAHPGALLYRLMMSRLR
jgi:hypothetical protein